MKFTEVVQKLVGSPIYVIMARYAYVGVLVEIADTAIVLANAFVVEDAGLGTDDKPRQVHAVGSSTILMTDAIETICQPVWAFKGEWSQLDDKSDKKNK